MVSHALVLTGLWFWVLLWIELFLLIIFTVNEYWGWSIVSVAALIAIYTLFSDFNPFVWVATHPIQFGLGLVAYFIPMGLLVGMFKWYLFILEAKEKNEEVKQEWIKNKLYRLQHEHDGSEDTRDKIAAYQKAINEGKLNEYIWDEWKIYEEKYLEWRYADGFIRPITRPVAKDNKNRIIAWIVWWPAVGLWSIINDPLYRIGRWIYRSFAGFLDRISAYVWKDVD